MGLEKTRRRLQVGRAGACVTSWSSATLFAELPIMKSRLYPTQELRLWAMTWAVKLRQKRGSCAHVPGWRELEEQWTSRPFGGGARGQ